MADSNSSDSECDNSSNSDDSIISSHIRPVNDIISEDDSDESNDDEPIDGETFDGIPSSSAWGATKRTFYNTDYIDKDYRKVQKKDHENAALEEEEALNAQKRLLSQLNPDEYNFEPRVEKQDVGDNDGETFLENMMTDLQSLSKTEKLHILNTQSPEFLSLIKDFQNYSIYLKEMLQPIVDACETEKYRPLTFFTGYKLIETKYHLILRYCLSITFYLMLKAEQKSRNHPVIQQLLRYKTLLTNIEELENKSNFQDEVILFLEKIKVNDEIKISQQTELISDMKTATTVNKRVTFEDTTPENDDSLSSNSVMEDENSEIDEIEKRGITYQIAKNKGLTAPKRKELRNPRVKHRMKYKKATARRKGQVREPRKEIKKYSGEMSGIRSSVIKSTKFTRSK